ncbi:MAG: dipeptidase [Candidatus Latescibacterota bacterium]
MRAKWISILTLAAMIAAPVFAGEYCVREEGGCFSIVAGKKATADGSVLFGHNEDNGFDRVAGMRKIERKDHPAGEWVTLPGGGRIPQVRTTWAYWWMQMPEIDYSDGFLNEHGVAIASDNCRSREDQPDLTDGGVGGVALRRLVMERARTAREGVQIIGSLIGQFGYNSSGRTMMVCDSKEGWLVAMVNGKHWVARRVPDDMVAAISNTYTIREIDLKDTKNFLGSSDIIDYAVRRGWYNPAQGPFSFEEAYADRKTRESIGNTHRQWGALRHLSASPVPVPEETRLPFAVKPKKPLTVADITVPLRDHYENTAYDPEAGYEKKPAHKRHTSSICGPYTNSSHVFQLRAGMPVEIGSVWWLAVRQPCSVPYVPFYLGSDTVPEQYRFETDPDDFNAAANTPAPVPGTAYRILGDLAKWVDADYAGRIPLLRARRDALEAGCRRYKGEFEKHLLKEWKRDPEYVRGLMSRYTQGIVARAVQDAGELMNGSMKQAKQ